MKILSTVLLTIVFTIQIQGQTTPPQELSLNSGPIEDRFEYIFKNSRNYREDGRRYEVVRYENLLTLKGHTLDSLNALKVKLKSTEGIVNAQSEEIESLKKSLNSTKETLDNTIAEKDSMSLFGMQMGKTGYNVLMWGIIIGLFALMIFFILKFKSSNSLTKAAQHKLAEVESEFDEHRRIALEREQKVRRQLQDEIMKHKKSK
ncbi:MAG: tRNA (guanine-N1)-methyltransferase [Winogradskyella sp.]|nr:tRNA (guanine-N1)-methyltransferase [Winogradskyella sp.]NNC45018.1 tRNA (guanine-N1)-methyltransferase [Winogradskyella sp.]